MKAAAVVCALGLASGAFAQPLEFVIDPTQSSIDLTIDLLITGVGSDSDSDSSSLSGFIQASFDDNAAPTESSLHDFFAAMDSDLMFNWSPSFLTTADATLVGGYVEYANPGVVLGPIAMNGSDVVFPSVPTIIGGVMTVNYSIFIFGSGDRGDRSLDPWCGQQRHRRDGGSRRWHHDSHQYC